MKIELKEYIMQFRRAGLVAEPDFPRRCGTLAVVSVVFFVLVLGFRSWDNLIHPGLYMEDAGHYFNNYYGVKRYFSFVLQHPNGYYNILNNVVAWAASRLDIRLQPLSYHLFALSLGMAVAACLAWSGVIRNRFILVVTPLALGLSGMNHIFYYTSLTFQMYNVVVLLLCLFYFPSPKTWLGAFMLMALAALLIWSGPYSVVALPVALLYLLCYEFDKKAVVCCGIIACILWYTSSLQGGMIRFENILDPDLRRTIIEVLFGKVFLLDLGGTINPIKVVAVLIGFASLFFGLRHDIRYLKIALLALSTIILSLAPLFLSEKILLYQRVFPCHLYIAIFFWIFFLLCSLDALLRRLPRYRSSGGALLAVAVVAVVWIDNSKHPDKGTITVMGQIPAFVEAIYQAEQLHLERENLYAVACAENIDPRAAPAKVRVGSRRWSAKPAPPERIGLLKDNPFLNGCVKVPADAVH